MHVKCPHCQHAIAIVSERGLEVVTCPSCGSQISVLSGDTVATETLSYRAGGEKNVGRFQLVERIGSGHFGDVWKARDPELDRFVALKLPRKEELDRADIELFVREARSAAQLKHPNIVSVHEVSRESDRVYIVSDLVEGPNLADWLVGNQVAPRQAAALCATIADAVHFAHDQGIIHRDLKPSNVLVGAETKLHLTDFGLAKRDGAEITMTIDGKIMGTPAYMSPEQARGDAHNADRRSDVYSLGVILYEMLAGERPFAGKSKMLLIHKVLHEEPRPPHKIRKAVPRDLETICLKALAKEPDRRYQTARELADDLRRYLDGRPILARPVGQIEKAWRWSRRNPVIAGCLATVAGALVVMGALAWRNRDLSEALEPLRHTVKLTTEPPGAEVLFVPLHSSTGEPEPKRAVKAGKSPVSTKLVPGQYLVVAWFDEQRFHEVFRRVPQDTSDLPDALPHGFWTNLEPGVIELKPVKIWDATVNRGMARLDGSPDFLVGSKTLPNLEPHHRAVPQFYLDAHEFTVGDWKSSIQAQGIRLDRRIEEQQIPDDHPLPFVNWDRAVHYAESIGKRLPDEIEYEFAATAGGRRAAPWGNDLERITDWPFGAVGEPAYDRVESDPPVTNLYSNVAEWTSTWMTAYPHGASPGPISMGGPSDMRMVRGGPMSVVEAKPDLGEVQQGPRTRFPYLRHLNHQGLGFRCARSVRPRLLPEDYVRLIP